MRAKNRCAHRRLKLSLGEVKGATLFVRTTAGPMMATAVSLPCRTTYSAGPNHRWRRYPVTLRPDLDLSR